MIHYQIGSNNPAGHYFDIVLTIPEPDPEGQVVRLPAWIPGSYMIRDFARNIVEIDATRGEQAVELIQLDKSSWQIEPGVGETKIKYRVYAWDLSVRSAHLDTTHGFFNGTSVFLEVTGQSDQPCSVEILRPQIEPAKDWRLATTLSRTRGKDFSFGNFEAQNYDELIDHPVEMGDFLSFDFSACGVRHDVVLTGRFDCDCERLKRDLSIVCEQHIRMFGEPAPMGRYLFLVMVVGAGYGGLEHRSSTSLVCSRDDLPQPGQSELTNAYRGFLGLCSHEYFHSWNVKRIKPAVFDAADLSQEVYTPLLWAFEGITSYYDDLALLRSGRITLQDYLELLGQTMTRVQRSIGRKRQSAAESSFNAWTKFYKQDENAHNAIISYYAKGTLIALSIDLKIRQITDHKKSLDDVMRLLWQDYLAKGIGVGDDTIQQVVSQVAGEDCSALLDEWIYGTSDLPLQQLLAQLGIEIVLRSAANEQDKGGKEASDLPVSSIGAQLKEVDGGVQIVSTREGEAAQHAGLSAGDVIFAVDGLKATHALLQKKFRHMQAGSVLQLHVFRRDELMTFGVTLQQAVADTVMLSAEQEDLPALLNWMHK
jgi:predicted metalloprotease with PDZ domain